MAKITSKLQVTLPKRLAEKHGIAPGDEVQFQSVAGVIRMVPAGTPPDLLGLDERLRLFDDASRRISQRLRQLSEPTVKPAGRGWTRDELYERGSPD